MPLRPWYVNASRVHLDRHIGAFAKAMTSNMRVLDAGAGAAPYRSRFKHATYEAADMVQVKGSRVPLDYLCDLAAIPVEDGRYDRVLCSQVLEHLPEPARVLAELYRVLKPGGQLLCSAPLFYEEHQKPYDFFRYTQFAMRRLIEGAGFRVIKLEWLEGYFGTVSYQFDQMVRHLPSDGRGRGWRRWAMRLVLATTRRFAIVARGAFARADVRWVYTASGHPKNYIVLAERPRAAEGRP